MPKFKVTVEHIVEAESFQNAIDTLYFDYDVGGEVVSVEYILEDN